MAQRSPINIKELKKRGILNEERFFSLLAQECNYIDPKVLKNFYMGLVRHLTAELRAKGVVRLPYIGDFALVIQKNKKGWFGTKMAVVPITYILRFFANANWKKYFSNLKEKGGYEGALDPRQKILNEKL